MKEIINHYVSVSNFETSFRKVFDLNLKQKLWVKDDEGEYTNMRVLEDNLGTLFDKEKLYKRLELIKLSENEKDVFLSAYVDFMYEYCNHDNTVMYCDSGNGIGSYGCHNHRTAKDIHDHWKEGVFYLLKDVYQRYSNE